LSASSLIERAEKFSNLFSPVEKGEIID